MKKLKVLFLITDLGKGGAERFLVDVCNELIKRNDVEFLIGSLFDNNCYPELNPLIKVVDLQYATFSLKRKNECIRYKELLLNFQPDIVHSNRYLAEFLTSYYVNRNITYVCHGHDNMIQFREMKFLDFFKKNLLINHIEYLKIRRDKYHKVKTWFIANSEHTYLYFQSVLPKNNRGDVRMIQYGFNFDRFKETKIRTIDSASKLKIINVGSFQKKKNQKMIVDIARELRKREIDFEIHLLGHGEERGYVQNLVKESALEEQIIFQGIQNNVEDWYKSSDIYLHTAYYEPFGLVFLEAMAAGLPVITLDGKGNRDLIDHGKNGFIHSEENPVIFADTIQQLIEDPELYHKMSVAGKDYARKFNISKKVDELVDFYKSIVKK